MESGKEKIGYIATARCIGILLVVYGHSFPFDVYIPPVLGNTVPFIYAFHMPLFIFLSGYLLTRNTRPTVEYICRRGSRLLVPYFALSVAAFLPKVLIQQFLNDTVELSLWYLLKTELIPRDNIWGHFWYIPVVFFLGSLGVIMQQMVHKHSAAGWTVLAATYILLFLPETTNWFAIEDMRKTAFYFALGMVVANWQKSGSVLIGRFWLLAFPAAVALFRTTDGILTDSLIACLMIGFVLHIGTKLDLEKCPVLSVIEKNSFTIFLLSWPAQAVVEVVCNRILHLPVLLTMGIMFAAGVGVPLICTKVVALLERRIPMKWVKLILGM